jgi:hypothetical protein
MKTDPLSRTKHLAKTDFLFISGITIFAWLIFFLSYIPDERCSDSHVSAPFFYFAILTSCLFIFFSSYRLLTWGTGKYKKFRLSKPSRVVLSALLAILLGYGLYFFTVLMAYFCLEFTF